MFWKTRTIETKDSGDEIKLICRLSEDRITVIYELSVNGVAQDELEISSSHAHLGNKYELSGVLHEEVKVTAKIESHFYMINNYTIYVGNEIVHTEKGRLGGL